jgi:hypothetical protein
VGEAVLRLKPRESEFAMQRVHHPFFFRKDLNRWEYPEPILVLLLFFPSKKEAEAMTDLERLGIWAARRAREEALKMSQNDQEILDDPLRGE